jgi:hypothetical protein
VRAIALIVIALLLGACYSGEQKPGPNDASTLDFTSTQTVVLDDSGIHPDVIHARSSAAITVTNHGTREHGLTSELVDTGTLHPGESTTVFFTATGTIEAHDRADPSHTATIEVSPASGS